MLRFLAPGRDALEKNVAVGDQERPAMQVQVIHLGDVGIMVPVHENRFTAGMMTKPCQISGQFAAAWPICGVPKFGRVTVKNCRPERADKRFQVRGVVYARRPVAEVKVREDEDGIGWTKRHIVVPIAETTTDRSEPC